MNQRGQRGEFPAVQLILERAFQFADISVSLFAGGLGLDGAAGAAPPKSFAAGL